MLIIHRFHRKAHPDRTMGESKESKRRYPFLAIDAHREPQS